MRSGDSFTHLVTFDTGVPDANVSWTLVDGDGTTVSSGNVTPAVGAVSVVLSIAGSDNTVPGGDLFADRELRWSYTVGGLSVSDGLRYRISGFLKFGVSESGVRNKLGVETQEIDNDQIDLVGAYSAFQTIVTEAALSAVTDASLKLVICDAIEALAALKLLPSLQVKLASKEVSGSDQFARAKIDWAALQAALNQMVAAGYTAVDPAVDPTADFGAILVKVVRPDPIIGEDV